MTIEEIAESLRAKGLHVEIKHSPGGYDVRVRAAVTPEDVRALLERVFFELRSYGVPDKDPIMLEIARVREAYEKPNGTGKAPTLDKGSTTGGVK